jgi:hypothetical protein
MGHLALNIWQPIPIFLCLRRYCSTPAYTHLSANAIDHVNIVEGDQHLWIAPIQVENAPDALQTVTATPLVPAVSEIKPDLM